MSDGDDKVLTALPDTDKEDRTENRPWSCRHSPL